MITNKTNEGMTAELYGISTDTKPTDVPNASTFLEIDTSDLYMFDAENQQWYVIA